MTSDGLSRAGLKRLDEVMARHVDEGAVPGMAWAVARHGDVHVGVAGTHDVDRNTPVREDSVFRISSTTKPITAVAALILLEECRLRLDEPVDHLLPELGDRRVLARPEGPLDDTIPAQRPITVRDVLTFGLGYGMDFATTGPQPVLQAMAELGLGTGPPAPAGPPEPDEWMRRLGTLPLTHQPGERWLYHTGADVLGVLIGRAAGQPFESFLRERILEPLGMNDTGFSVPADALGRFGPCYLPPGETGDRDVYDPTDGQWASPPAFPSGGAGLVATVPDLLAFGEMLRAGGTYPGGRIISRPSIEAMTTDQLTPGQKASGGADPSGSLGWGFGVGVQLRRTGPARSVGTYGWDGGLGSAWANDPVEDLTGILLTNQMWPSPEPPPVFGDFWTCAYAAIDD